ncbi:MAG: alpha/beta hydrolase [Myxococcales bacterium]|nr:alpha/beta hydrolase [Myxococcales bacterium]
MASETGNGSVLVAARRQVGSVIFGAGLNAMAWGGKLHPLSNPKRHAVERITNIAYKPTGDRAHLLDVYRPMNPSLAPTPAVLYIHGGAFRILSKDTHWMMALAFARQGYTVFNISYRLAPKHKYPAALEDSAAAALWVKRRAAEFGADPDKLVLAGESAGANLVTSLAVMSSYRRDEPFAREVFDADIAPKAVVAGCGILQVTEPMRLVSRKQRFPAWLADRLIETADAYIPEEPSISLDLANPLLVLERGEKPDRPLPPFFSLCGTKDPLLDDTRRLRDALDALDVENQCRIYPGEMHAFHAMVWRKKAQQCWRDQYAFLDPKVGLQ